MSPALTHLKFSAPIKLISEANNYDHWRVKALRKRQQQLEMSVALINALRGRRVLLPCTVKLTRVGMKLLDEDNLAGSFKAVQDAIAKRLGLDDGDRSKVKWHYQQVATHKRHYELEVEIKSEVPKCKNLDSST